MTRHKMEHTVEPVLLRPENPHVECNGRDISDMIQQIRDAVLYSGNAHIITRAELSWMLLTYEERHEYARRTYSLPINGFDLFMYDYICLSGSELKGSMKALYQNLVNKH